MQTIILAGWREGLQKVALANVQRELLRLPLKEAKENVDQLLEAGEGELSPRPVVLQVSDEVATEFLRRADELGALVGHVSFLAAKAPTQRKANSTTNNPRQAA